MKKNLVKMVEKYWVVIVVFAGIIAAGLALLLSIGQPIWFDEGYSILLAKQPVGELFALTAVDAHPPFYYLLLKLWGEIFGFSEVALRSLSAVMLGGAVSVMLLLIRRLFGVRVALVAIPVLVIAPFALRYGYEVRMYALASLIGVSATYVLVRAREGVNKWWWGGYAALVALGMLTLYMTLAVWIAHVVWLAWTSLRDKRQKGFKKWKWLYVYAGAVVLFAPYIPTFLYQLKHSALPGIGRELTLTSVVDIATMTSLYTAEWAMGGWMSLLLGIMLVVLVYAAIKAYRAIPRGQRSFYLLFVILTVVPILFFAVSSLPPRPPVYVVRYIAHIVLFVYALTGITMGLYWIYVKGRKSTAVMMYLGVLVVACLGVLSLARTGNFNFERMQDPQTATLRDTVQCTNDTVTVADDPYTYIDSFFYFSDCNLRFYGKDNVARAGGYAMLHNSKMRIPSADVVTSKRIIHLHWTGQDVLFNPGDRYRLVDTTIMDKQIVDTYELNAE